MKKILDIAVIGSGLAALNFADTYTNKGKKINLISFENKDLINSKNKNELKFLPSQMKGKSINVKNFFSANNFELQKGCKVLGSLEFGGLSNYWGLQMDNYFNKSQKISSKTFKAIENHLIKLLNKFQLIGSYVKKNKILYKNDFHIPDQLNSLTLGKKNNYFNCEKPILGFFSQKNFKGNLNHINEEENKLSSFNFLKKIKKNKRINILNLYVKKILKNKKKIELVCVDRNNNEKRLKVKKLVLAAGTISTTKIIADYLNFQSEIKVKHHPRLFSVFFSKKAIKSKMKFTPSILQIIRKSNQDYFSADLRPGNKMITDSIEEFFPFIKPFKPIINFLNHRIIFSNILLDSKDSDIYMKKINEKFRIYSKKFIMKKILKKKNKKIYKFLLSKKIIYPFYYTHFPGPGADYHYFGTIPFNTEKKLSVDNNCKLKGSNNIYVVDSSIFEFKKNKYPLGIVMANARRVGSILSKIKT
jgi:hypothetical protein